MVGCHAEGLASVGNLLLEKPRASDMGARQVDPSWTKTGIGGKELGFEVAAGNRGLRSLTRKPCLLPPGRTAAQRPPQRHHRHKSVGEGGNLLEQILCVPQPSR